MNVTSVKNNKLMVLQMSRLTIEITAKEHQEIKAMAALQGKTLKKFVMEKIFSTQANSDEEEVWEELKSMLRSRIDAAESGAISKKTMQQIAEDRLKKIGAT